MTKNLHFSASIGVLACSSLLLSACASGGSASADSENSCDLDTVRVLVSSQPGSPIDSMAREMASALQSTGFEPSVVIETRTGGSGAVALSALVGGPADGSTLYAMARSEVLLFSSGELHKFGPDALDYLIRLQDDPYAWVVRADSKFKTLEDLISYAEDNPGAINVGGFGTASAHHLAALQIAKQSGIDIAWIPFDGGSAAVTALLGGHIDVANTNPGPVLEQVRAGELRILGVASEERLPGLAETPTFKDSGTDFVSSHWRGLVAKAGMPAACKEMLEDALTDAYETDSFQQFLEEQNVLPGYMPSEEFEPYVLQVIDDSKALLNEVGLG